MRPSEIFTTMGSLAAIFLAIRLWIHLPRDTADTLITCTLLLLIFFGIVGTLCTDNR